MQKKTNKKSRKKLNTIPGTPIYTGDKDTDPIIITHIEYNKSCFQENVYKNLEKYKKNSSSTSVSWLNIDGIYDLKVIEDVNQHYNIHPLVLEDILNVSQRPKFEDFKDYMFIVLKMFQYEPETFKIYTEQVSVLLFENNVVTFQEKEGDVFDPIRDRIRNVKGRISTQKADYLAYSLIDAIVDNYYIILENIGEKIEEVEEEVFSNPTRKTVEKIHYLKQEIIQLRKSIWPIRDIANGLIKSDSPLLESSIKPFLQDLYDHTIELMDIIESYRDMTTSLMDMYLSNISNKMNEIMKVLTMMSTLFIPLTFMAGIYGMNFKYMPELEWRYGYPLLLSIMMTIAIGMFFYFKRKKWL
ncbi:MAG: magnesium and cobalt transport protein CorA [Candidatus Margulisbacteria bacterium GWF2_35_9]|nr:MAG: magnesium and cobalt transport protein CorA [Candidatus Margulisbacteria bacterium GWF2_35_9]